MNLDFVSLASEADRILQLVEKAVLAKTGGRIRGLNVRINDGCLVVSGRTSTYYNKQLATHAARNAGLDMSVQNDVEVC